MTPTKKIHISISKQREKKNQDIEEYRCKGGRCWGG